MYFTSAKTGLYIHTYTLKAPGSELNGSIQKTFIFNHQSSSEQTFFLNTEKNLKNSPQLLARAKNRSFLSSIQFLIYIHKLAIRLNGSVPFPNDGVESYANFISQPKRKKYIPLPRRCVKFAKV